MKSPYGKQLTRPLMLHSIAHFTQYHGTQLAYMYDKYVQDMFMNTVECLMLASI